MSCPRFKAKQSPSSRSLLQFCVVTVLTMSKRLSSGQSNTLLNYFQSPKVKREKEIKKENGTEQVDELVNGVFLPTKISKCLV